MKLRKRNRLSADGFLSNNCAKNHHLYGVNGAGVTHDFAAYVLDYQNGYALIEVRNNFKLGDHLEVFGPGIHNLEFEVTELTDENNEVVWVANQPMKQLRVKIPFPVSQHDMMRRVRR